LADIEQSKGCLLVSRNDLFGARMLPFINALRIGHDYDLPVKIYWPFPPNDVTNIGEYRDVFSHEFIDKHFITHQEFQHLSRRAVTLAQVKLSPALKIADMVRNGSILALHSGETAMTLGGEDAKFVHESYRATLDRISFTPTVARNIAKIKVVTQDQKLLAYHVRHGDVTTSYRAKNRAWIHKFIPCEFFAQHFEKVGQHRNCKALLFGDFKPSLDWLCAQCPDLIPIADVIDLKELGSLQRDFLELYAMSRAELIVGPRSSGFSQLAASLGGVAFRDIMKDMEPADYEVAFSKLYTRLKTDPASFSSFGETAQCLAHLVPFLVANHNSRKAASLIENEIGRGNEIAYLFRLWAEACFHHDDFDAVLAVRERSMQVPMFDASAVASTDALASRSAFLSGDNEEALRLLNLATSHSPFAEHILAAFKHLDDAGLIQDTTFFPIDRDLMNILHPAQSPFQPALFAWEWRHSLMSNFQRPLTHGGAGRRLLAQGKAAIEKPDCSPQMNASFLSFQSLIFMGLGETIDALSMSMEAIDTAPQNPHILRRHVQNLLRTQEYQAALPICQALCEMAPNVAIYKTLLAEIYFGLKQRKKAMSAIQESQIGKLRYPAITLKQANGFLMAKQPEKADELLANVLPEIRWPDQFLDAQTSVKIKLGRQNEMMPILLQLQEEAGAMRNVSHLIARIRRANGDLEGAAKDAAFAVSFGPNLGKYKVLLATIFRELGREEEASEIIAQLPTMMQKRFLKR
jgi:tetratricopeptide (TPR) repeat protein